MGRRVTQADKLQAHFYELADEMGADVVYGWRFNRHVGAYSAVVMHAQFLPFTAEVGLPHRIRNSAEYFVALHELGHLADQRKRNGQWSKYRRYSLLTSERRAWEWALEHACIKPTRQVWKRIYSSLLGYAKAYRKDKRVKQDPKFDRLLQHAGWSGGR